MCYYLCQGLVLDLPLSAHGSVSAAQGNMIQFIESFILFKNFLIHLCLLLPCMESMDVPSILHEARDAVSRANIRFQV